MTQPTKSLPRAAANGLLDRRLFMQSMLLGTAGAGANLALANPVSKDQPEWLLRPGATTEVYGQPSPFERERTGRMLSPVQASRGVSASARTPLHLLHGTITPAGLHFEVNHHGIPQIDPDRHALVIHGMVRQPIKLTADTLSNYPTESHQYFLECSGNSGGMWSAEPSNGHLGALHGLLSASEWTGVPLSVLLDEAGLLPGAKWIIAEGGDSGSMSRSIPIDKAFDDAMIALYQNGERLRPGQGYPMRLFNPGYEGSANTKWIRSLRVTDKPTMTRFETSTYTDLMPDGEAMQFSLPMDVKSVITRPANNLSLRRKGVYEITGLAWSGRGRITGVEVSADGGQSWAPTALQAPVLPKMLTRFRIPWEWQGAPAVLQSRATDEHGNVQPSRAALIAVRGRNSRYHFNGIHSWGVDAQGGISHVYA